MIQGPFVHNSYREFELSPKIVHKLNTDYFSNHWWWWDQNKNATDDCYETHLNKRIKERKEGKNWNLRQRRQGIKKGNIDENR